MTPTQKIKRQATLTLAHFDHQKGLNAHAYFKVNNQTTSDDLVQDTFLKTWVYLARGGKIDTMKAFLYHVLNNLIVDEYRKRKSTSLDVLLEKGYEPSIDSAESLINLLDGKAATLLLAMLPEPYRAVMRMRYIQDLSLQEMATLTGKSKNTMAVQVHRGLGKLRTLYGEKALAQSR